MGHTEPMISERRNTGFLSFAGSARELAVWRISASQNIDPSVETVVLARVFFLMSATLLQEDELRVSMQLVYCQRTKHTSAVHLHLHPQWWYQMMVEMTELALMMRAW
jgi:hypothetical protein